MSRLDELRFPLEPELLLSQAAIWLAEGSRPIPIKHLFTLGAPTSFRFMADLSSLDALFIALSSGRLQAHGICAHQALEVRPPFADRCPPDDMDSQIPPSLWGDLSNVDWLKSELKSDTLGCVFWMIKVKTADLMATFPSLARAEEAYWQNGNLRSQGGTTGGVKKSDFHEYAEQSKPSEGRKPRRRGPRPEKRSAIITQMLKHLNTGVRKSEELFADTEEALAAQYKASRQTVREARHAALSEFQRANPDKTPTRDK